MLLFLDGCWERPVEVGFGGCRGGICRAFLVVRMANGSGETDAFLAGAVMFNLQARPRLCRMLCLALLGEREKGVIA